MDSRIKLGLQTLRSAHAFLAQQELHGALGDIAPHTTALQAAIDRLEAHATEQGARALASRAATVVRQDALRRLRREYLRPIAHIARTLLAHDPTVRRAYRIPKSTNVEVMMQTASAFVELVRDHRERFLAHGLAPDFVERMQSAVDEFHAVRAQRGMDKAARAGATAGLRHELTRARAVVTLIDLMLTPRLEHEPAQLAEWKSVSRFIHRASHSRPVEGSGEAADLQLDSGGLAPHARSSEILPMARAA